MASGKKKFYAYVVPASRGGTEKRGLVSDWASCEKLVKGVPGARYRGFDAKVSAEAWLAQGARYEVRPARPIPALVPGIYFDAGTGRGKGVEVSVTDEKRKNLLHRVLPERHLNRFGKHLLRDASATNNYGELLALWYALQIAKKMKIKKIFGDSRLVIDYWSEWRIKRKEVAEETVALAEEVARLREEFEKKGGTVERISGAHNPADLGFHS